MTSPGKKGQMKNRVKKVKAPKWRQALASAKYRCNNPNFTGYRNYGGRGIKCFLTAVQTEYLWNRDRAYFMAKPSLDRIDNDGNYAYGNCRFIEFKDNHMRALLGHVMHMDYSFVCSICGKDYKALRYNQKTCSAECRRKKKNRADQVYHQNKMRQPT